MERHYDAFISYSHAPLDSKVAADIQSSLEKFSIPKVLQKSHNKKRIGPIFLSKEESASNSLSNDTELALKDSDFLIVICSVDAARSASMQVEIEAFLQDHDRQHILTVLADGDPQEVIPDILYREEIEVQGKDGTVHTEARTIEPLTCDYRGNNADKQEELLRLAAAILGCSDNEIRQQQSKRKIRQIVAGFTAALLLVSAAAAFAATRAIVSSQQADQLQEQLQEQNQEQTLEESRRSLINESRYLATKSEELLAQGDQMGAIQLALAALPASEEDNSRPLVAEAFSALNDAVYPYHVAQFDDFLPKYMMKIDGTNSYNGFAWYRFSPNYTRWMTTDSINQIYVFDLERGTRIAVLSPLDVSTGTEKDVFLILRNIVSNEIRVLCNGL